MHAIEHVIYLVYSLGVGVVGESSKWGAIKKGVTNVDSLAGVSWALRCTGCFPVLTISCARF